jgi:signal peptidase I
VGALASAAVVAAAIAYLIVRWRPFAVEIRGESMAPTLRAGDWALAVPGGPPRRGQVVVVEHPRRPGFELVKRITAAPGDLAPSGEFLGADEYWVEGDHPVGSTDSRHFGPVTRDRVKATVRLVYWPVYRRGVLRRSAPPRGGTLG